MEENIDAAESVEDSLKISTGEDDLVEGSPEDNPSEDLEGRRVADIIVEDAADSGPNKDHGDEEASSEAGTHEEASQPGTGQGCEEISNSGTESHEEGEHGAENGQNELGTSLSQPEDTATIPEASREEQQVQEVFLSIFSTQIQSTQLANSIGSNQLTLYDVLTPQFLTKTIHLYPIIVSEKNTIVTTKIPGRPEH